MCTQKFSMFKNLVYKNEQNFCAASKQQTRTAHGKFSLLPEQIFCVATKQQTRTAHGKFSLLQEQRVCATKQQTITAHGKLSLLREQNFVLLLGSRLEPLMASLVCCEMNVC